MEKRVTDMGKAHLSSFWTRERQQAYNHWYYLHKRKKKEETFTSNAQDYINRILHEPYLNNLKHNYELGKKIINKILKIYEESSAESKIKTKVQEDKIWATNPTYNNPNKVRPHSPNDFNTTTWDDATNWDDF